MILGPSGFKIGFGQPSRLKIVWKYVIKYDCIFRRPGNWNVDSIRQTLDSADLIVSPGCNSSRNGSSGFSSGRNEWIPLFQISGYLLGYLGTINITFLWIPGYLDTSEILVVSRYFCNSIFFSVWIPGQQNRHHFFHITGYLGTVAITFLYWIFFGNFSIRIHG